MRQHKNFTFLCAPLALIALLIGPAKADIMLGFQPPSQTINVGNTANVDISVSGLGNGASPALGGYDLFINYDSTILTPTGVTFSTRLGDTSLFEALASNSFLPNQVEITETSLLSAASLFAHQSTPDPGFVIATLSFEGVAGGTSSLTFSPPAVGGLVNENGADLTAVLTAGSITVNGSTSTVPEPTSVLLLATVVIGLASQVRCKLRG